MIAPPSPRAGRHPVLHPGAVEHYEDAAAYEARYASRSEDVRFYLRNTKQAVSVLEYGAGAGRLTLPLCRRGIRVVAIDTSFAMLELLRKRLAALPPGDARRVTVLLADMRSYSTRRRFDTVIAGFHTVCHLYSVGDMASFLSRVFVHLRPGGSFLFDLPLPRIDMPGYDPIAQVRVTEMEGTSGPELLTQRWFQPQEIRMHLAYAGFTRVRLGADFTNQRLSQETSVMTVVAKKPLRVAPGRS